MSLEKATGIPKFEIHKIIYYPWLNNPDDTDYFWGLKKYADKYGFVMRVMHGKLGVHLSVYRQSFKY